MLNDFDNFCDQFEDRASKAYHTGDQNNGRVVSEIERVGENPPMAVREIEHPTTNFGEASESIVNVPPSIG
jgi:hypothetical protein